jgi:hypothetical protein
LKISLLTSTDDHTALLRRALICVGVDVPSFSFKKEGTKKVNPAVPSGTSLSVPLYKANQEIDIFFVCTVLQGLPPRAAGEEDKPAFLQRLVEPGGVADSGNICLLACVLLPCWRFYLKRQRKS